MMRGKSKAQAALEYIIIVSMVLVFMIPIWTYVSSMQSQTSVELALTYAKNTANQIADAANLVYSQGPPAKLKISVYIPYGVENVTIVNSTIKFTIWARPGYSDVFAFSNAQLNGTLPTKEGYYWMDIEATDNIVQITKSTA